MPTTTFKALPLPTQGVTTTWGDALNNYPFVYIDSMLGGITTKSLSSGAVALTAAESRTLILRLTGTITADVLVTTLCQGFTLVENLTSGSFTVTMTNAITYGGTAVGTPVTIPQGGGYVVVSDAVNGSRLVLPAAGASGAASAGRVCEFPGITVPTGWLKMNGALVSRASYPALWAYANASGNLQTDANWVANAMYGCFSSGDGSTTFRLPDGRSYFRRGWADDATLSQDYGRTCGSYQAQSIESHSHTGSTGNESNTHTHPYGRYGSLVGGGSGSGVWYNTANGTTSANTQTHTHNFTTNLTGGTQTKPQNIAMMVCIAYV